MEEMDSSARRRVNSILRHLLLSPTAISPSIHTVPNSFSGEPAAPVIVGGMVLDINAKPFANPLPGTTMPGKVQYVSGGVARNVAECMSKLGCKPFMISILGHDMAGDQLLKYWNYAGLPTEGILKYEGISTPVVSNVFNSDGEVAAGVASVDAVEKFLTPDWIRRFERKIQHAPIMFIDANLPPTSLQASCQMATDFGIPVWFEPVSVTKSARIASIVNNITCASPNEHELIAMANAVSPLKKFNSIDSIKSKQPVESLFRVLQPAIAILLEKGVKLLIVTLGAHGVLSCSRESPDVMKNLFKNSITNGSAGMLYELVNDSCSSRKVISLMKSSDGDPCHSVIHFPALPATVASLTGAGDCLVGGILASICSGLDVLQSTAVGIAVAKAAVEAESNVPIECNLTSVADDAKKIFWAAKPLR